LIFNLRQFLTNPIHSSLCIDSGTTNDVSERTDQSQALATTVDVAAIPIPLLRRWIDRAPLHPTNPAQSLAAFDEPEFFGLLTHDMQ
jgi:hypothetical protein